MPETTNTKIPVAILGASGYTGAELIRLLSYHPNVEIVSLSAESNAGKSIGEVYPHLASFRLPKLVALNEVKWNDIQAVFCCLPHGTVQEIVYHLPKHLKVIDLSADFRLFDMAAYEKWYHKPHIAQEMQREAVYGLTEIFRSEIAKTRLVACPGCYPTSILLPLLPLVVSGKISLDSIIADSKSGITGAGRSAKVESLFSEVNEGVRPYGLDGHRHVAEIEQAIAAASGTKTPIIFTPQVVPMNRGILSNIYVKTIPGTSVDQLREVLTIQYNKEKFVKVLPKGRTPSSRDVIGSNMCHMAVFESRVPGRALIVSVIDNLIKGASGQAVQNFNLMFDFPEHSGLKHIPIFP